jgi:UMF1 family MFS transporter
LPLFSSDALNPGVHPREVFGWAMYDFANSGYTTVVITAVFSAYFVGAVAGGASWAPLAWTLTLCVSHLIVMASMPALGAWADRHAAKKRLLLLSTVGCVVATGSLALVSPGALVLGVCLVVLSNVFFAWGESLVAAFLPELARPAAMGRVSGWGWGLGYTGGMLALGLSLAYVLWAQAKGLPAAHFVPVTMLITAAIFALASLVTFGLLREHARPKLEHRTPATWRSSLHQVRRTFAQARRYRDFMGLLGCAVAYQGGVAVTEVDPKVRTDLMSV